MRVALRFAAMIVVAAHRHLRADVREQLGRDPRIFGEDPVGVAQRVRSARAKVAEIADRRCDDVQSGRQSSLISYAINLFQFNRKRVIVQTFICLGEGTMIALLGASAINLAALQASIAAPTTRSAAVLRDAADQGHEREGSRRRHRGLPARTPAPSRWGR